MYDLSKPQKSVYEMETYAGGSISVVCGSMFRKGTRSLEELQNAVNKIYEINDALRLRIVKTEHGVQQEVEAFVKQDAEVLGFKKKEVFDLYADACAKEPLDLYGLLCIIKIIFLEDRYGILIKLHHVIGDAWALSLICSQFNAILSGEVPKAYSYVKYLDKEKLYMRGNGQEKDKAFFLERFKECDEVTFLSEKEGKSFCSARKTFMLDAGKTGQIVAYAKEWNVSSFVLFMAALAIYMNRTKMNVDKFYIGTAALNRAGKQDKSTVGMFINSVPMLIRLDNEKSFLDNLLQIRQESFSVFRHQRYGYSEVLKDIREAYHFNEKLYDVVLSYQNATVFGGGEEVETTWYHNGMQMESLQIHIDDRDEEGTFRMHYDYQVEKFTEKEIIRMHGQMMRLLFDAMVDDGKKLYELEMLSEVERKMILSDFNVTRVEYPQDKCVHQLFEEQVRKTPNKVAVIAWDKTLTYEELNKQANQIAYGLMERGIGVGDMVAFVLPRQSYLLAVIFGILKTGAAYLPIDIDLPDERISYMLKDSNAKLCITTEKLKELSLENGVPNDLQNPNVAMTGENLCYCIYTSGSTGRPKGVLIRHRNLVNLCTANEKNCYQTSALSQDKVLLSTAKCCFDAFAIDYALFLLNGKTIVLADDSDLMDGTKLAGLAKKYDVEVLQSTPSTIKALCANDAYAKMLGQIKVLILAAEKFTSGLYGYLRTMTDADVFNGYGPSETTVGASIGKIDSEDIHIGKPIANTQIYIMDKFLRPVPIGVTGELCVAGAGVGAGYLNRPELTAERFVDNPFGGGKLYKTGDLAYWREDGNVVYVGRNDFQVKIHGLRIELEEIEDVISCIKGISQNTVIVCKSDEGRDWISAFYTGKEIPLEEFHEIIGKRLPKYMMPHLFVHLNSMPLTASGKIDIKALSEKSSTFASMKTEYVAPRTEKEKVLIEMMEMVLGIEQIGIMDNFFELGGDSLKVIELIAKLEERGFRIDTRMIFSCDTVKKLAQMMNKQDCQIVGMAFGKRMNDIPATPAQMRIYTAQSIQNNLTTYNIPYMFKMRKVDKVRLQQALIKLIKRHEIFRTRFENKEGKIIQIIEENVSFALEEITYGDVLSFIRPFDLSKAPLIRVGYRDDIIIIDIHHIIVDGFSIPIFFHELNELYMGRSLEDDSVPYYQFAMEKVDYTESEKYWLSVYKDELPRLELRTDYDRKEKRSFKGCTLYDSIDISFHHKIIEKCKTINITPYVFYLSGFQILLSKFSGNDDIVVGIPISGRTSKYLNTIGMFVNTIAFRSQPKGMKSVQIFLEEIKGASANAILYQNYPYGELVKKLNANMVDRNPLFDVMFTYQSERMMQVRFGDCNIEPLPVTVTTSKYDFTFNIMPFENDVVVMVEYCTELYSEATIRRFIEGYRNILMQMLTETTLLKEISAVTVEERRKLMVDFNNTVVEYPKVKCVHQLFENQAENTPDEIAVIACDQTLTYAELDKQANSVAHALSKKGIGKGDVVAFALPRKSYLVSIMFGILKSGAVYLPIDSEYPQERIEYMLSDSGAKVFITDEMINELLCEKKSDSFMSDISSESICYCIYTSGTTGKPKGILIRHCNVVNFVQNNGANAFQSGILNGCSHFISANSISFDITLQEIYLPLLNGKSVILLSDEQMYNIAMATHLFEGRKCGLVITPSKLSVYMSDKTFCNSMRNISFIMCGAETFPQQLLHRIREYTDAIVYNGYGPTETTCGVLYSQVKMGDGISIGKPIANTQIYIVDKFLRPVPIGVTGELCVAGAGVGAGYLNRPELTAERFVDNPFGGGKLYKTGDLAYWREDGNVVYVGRNDFQVKIHGLRIELEEIESAIYSVDGISHAAVVVREDKDRKPFICAFYTSELCVDVEKIREAIRKKLPRYMMPRGFQRLPQMPLMTNGKINRRLLPDVVLSQNEKSVAYEKPEDEMEKRIVLIMEQVLDFAPIGRGDDFFDLGGDSLKAIEFVSKMHGDGIYFTMQNVYDHPTVRGLAEYIKTDNHQTVSLGEVDFTIVNKVLEKNRVEYMTMPRQENVGSLLLAGATGYLGIHILDNFLEHDDGIVYCLVRGKNQTDSEKRFEELLEFYFGDKYKKTPRIKVICADLQKDGFGLSQSEYFRLLSAVDTVVNAAASVKHYGSYQYFYEINVEAVRRLIEFCLESGAKLIHTSTMSVSGNSFADTFEGYVSETEKHFYESNLYIGQPLNNVYARSKFEAEKLVLESVQKGLRANIMRLGNLTNRFRDGIFQKNHETNAFLMRIKAILEMGLFPDYLMDLYLEFTPVDAAAEAIMTIARHFDAERTVFHINSTKVVYMDKMMSYFKELECPLEVVSGEVFTDALRKTMEQKGQEHIFETFINDMDEDDHLNYDSKIRIENGFTAEYLKRLGFEWPDIDLEYLEKYIAYFRKIKYLEV